MYLARSRGLGKKEISAPLRSISTRTSLAKGKTRCVQPVFQRYHTSKTRYNHLIPQLHVSTKYGSTPH